jgi:hypothetical protein
VANGSPAGGARWLRFRAGAIGVDLRVQGEDDSAEGSVHVTVVLLPPQTADVEILAGPVSMRRRTDSSGTVVLDLPPRLVSLVVTPLAGEATPLQTAWVRL